LYAIFTLWLHIITYCRVDKLNSSNETQIKQMIKTRHRVNMFFQFLAFTVMVCLINSAMATEQAKYEVTLKDRNFEVRDYPANIVAETNVSGTFEDAGGKSFKRLFRYISGDNKTQDKISMTAPVSQVFHDADSDELTQASQTARNGLWAVTFMMPAEHTMDTLPLPNDPAVTLRQVPPTRYAVVRYSGFWSEKAYQQYRQQLDGWIADRGFKIKGESVWARYNSPFTPWFLRRNEILIPIRHPAKG